MPPLDSLIGPGFSGYSILAGIPLLMLPTGSPENENMHKSSGAFHSDPAKTTGQLPAKQRRSLVVSLQTLVSPKIWPLVKNLTYGWRQQGSIDTIPEVPFTYVAGNREGYEGLAHIDEVSVEATPEDFLKLSINFTSWVWDELGNPISVSKSGTPVLNPHDALYKPVAGWATIPRLSLLPDDSIPLRWGLRLANNWNYQSFLSGYSQAPNPALITAGNLDVTLDLSWLAQRRSRPLESGSAQIQIGADPVISTLYLDQVIREPARQFNNVGNPDQVIQWQASFFAKGNIPRSN